MYVVSISLIKEVFNHNTAQDSFIKSLKKITNFNMMYSKGSSIDIFLSNMFTFIN